MDVIIVSKTHMSNAACVGAISGNGKFVRLLDKNGHNQDIETSLKIGDVWTINYQERPNKIAPHIEDILVTNMTFKVSFGTIKEMIKYLREKLKVKVWSGSTEVLFDGKIQWTSGGSGYISKTGEIPDNSVGFWIPDQDLPRKDFKEKVRYSYPIRWRNISYVGYQNPVDRIPANTLVRVSLARWWTPNEDEERCYLQLSGWYDLSEPKQPKKEIEEDDNILF